MTLDPGTALALANEIRQDPHGIGFTGLWPGQIAAKLNTTTVPGDTLPPQLLTVPELLLLVGAQGLTELQAAGLVQLLPALVGTAIDLGNPQVVQLLQQLLTGSNPSSPVAPHCLQVLQQVAQPQPCTRAEKLIGVRGATFSAEDVCQALGFFPYNGTRTEPMTVPGTNPPVPVYVTPTGGYTTDPNQAQKDASGNPVQAQEPYMPRPFGPGV